MGVQCETRKYILRTGVHDVIRFLAAFNKNGRLNLILIDKLTFDVFVGELTSDALNKMRYLQNLEHRHELRVRFTMAIIKQLTLGNDNWNVTVVSARFGDAHTISSDP